MSRLVVALALAAGIASGEAPAADSPEEHFRRQDLARAEYLIGMLASKNSAPTVKGNARMGDDEVIDFPRNYDKSLQVPVYLAAQQLLAEGDLAMNPLLTHVGDERYSFSVNYGETDYNVSVSRACDMIAERILLPFDDELHFLTRDQLGIYPSEKTRLSLTEWWGKNKQRGLKTLQVEAIDAMMAFMEKVDGKTAGPVHQYAKPYPIKEFNRLRQENLRILKSIRRTIIEQREPYRPKSLDDKHRYIFGLPWTGRRHNL